MTPACCRGLDAILDQSAVEDEGYHLLGAEPGKTYLVMHINDPKGLVAHEKGAGLAWATNLLVPEFIENQIYSQVSDQMKQQFKEKGSDITVEITKTPPKGQKPTSDLGGGVFLGLLLAGLGYGAVKLVTK